MAGIPFSFQVDKFQDIVKYTQGNVGSLLCGLCGFMWFVKVRPISARLHVNDPIGTVSHPAQYPIVIV